MHILKRIFNVRQSKPYKIQDQERKAGRFGITASSLRDLRLKAAEKLCIAKNETFRIVLEEDGTEVKDESYFETIPEQTTFVILKSGQFWDGYITYLKLATKKILQNITPNTAILRTIDSLLSDPESSEMVAIINYVKDLELNIKAETVTEDPDWFMDVPGNLITKEAVLKRSAKGRIRSYLNSSKDFVNHSDLNPATREYLLGILKEFRYELKRVHYYQDYFARSSDSGLKFCNELGWFECEGPFNKRSCKSFHKINPYGSRDARILFKTWNLDHHFVIECPFYFARIERSREVLPSMIKAAQECPEDHEVNSSYFYKLLFTRTNLKIVDVRCHAISAHDNSKVDHDRIYRKRKINNISTS